MSRISELFLRVNEADESDFGKSLVRVHGTDKPRDINWGDHIRISLDKKNWVNCRLEPAGDIGAGKIYVGIHLRGLINKETIGIPIIRVGAPSSFCVRKAAPWQLLVSIMIGIIVIGVFAYLAFALGLVGQ